MSMTPEAKSKLSKIIRGTQGSANVGLRGKLLKDLEDETRRRYHLTIKQLSNAGLDEAHTAKRKRLEDWIDEQVRAESGKNKRTAEDFLIHVVRQAAYTLLNRIVILRLMEAMELREVLVVTGGWNSSGYRDFRQLAPALCRQQQDPTEGYAFLLQLVFEELAMDMPGLYGSAGMADLIPVPPETLRAVIEAFDDPELESCWTDDMSLGWVYQYWNDPDREALDAKINDGGKIEPHEIASKTQMFTERYMVDWLLQNSLGPMWLAMCRKHGWTPECESNGTLDRLEQRRIEWRAKRDAGEVSLTDLMPLHTDEERRWAYYVPQPIPDDAIQHAPDSVRDIKLIDPAVGSGHFLVVAFDLLFALYQEEARHRAASIREGEAPAEPRAPARQEPRPPEPRAPAQQELRPPAKFNPDDFTPQSIAERILEHNLHGIDLDPRAVQIAAAALWLKAKRACPEAKPAQLNLVASNLRLSSLPDNDPALVELRRTVAEETGIPADLTNSIVHALSGADHLGSLLKVDTAVDDAIRKHEATVRAAGGPRQKKLFDEEIPIRLNATQPGTGSTAKPGVAASRRTPGNETTNAPNPDGVPQSAQVREKRDVEPRWGSEHTGDGTWGAPVTGDPRLCCETPLGLNADEPATDSATHAIQPGTGSTTHAVQPGTGSTTKPGVAASQRIPGNETNNAPNPDGVPQTPIVVNKTTNTRDAIKASVLERLEDFLSRHTSGNDLGLRLRGEQLAAGVRFMRLVRESAYDLVVANPPYQGTAKMSSAKYVETHYPLGKADLFAAFLLRGLELVRKHGVSSMLTMRNWMFIKQYSGLREHLLNNFGLRAIGDFDRGAFEDIVDEVVSVAIATFARCERGGHSIALCPTPRDDRSRDNQRTNRKRAATLCHVGRHEFDPEALKVVPEWPLVYWWNAESLLAYSRSELLGGETPASKGLCTGDETRFTRFWCECRLSNVWKNTIRIPSHVELQLFKWFPYIKGGKGRKWFEPLVNVVKWDAAGLSICIYDEVSSGVRLQNTKLYFRQGIAFTKIGQIFDARLHRFLSIFSDAGPSVFPKDVIQPLVLLNSQRAANILRDLNPTQNFQVGDVNRLPVIAMKESDRLFAVLEGRFSQHERTRESSVEFKQPGPSPWRYAQEWAQVAVDRPEGAPLPEYVEVLDPEPPTDHLSFALGVALGRFGANGEGILDWDGDSTPTVGMREGEAPAEPYPGTRLGRSLALPHEGALPAGILFLDGTLAANERTDGLGHPAAQPLLQAWTTYGSSIAPKSNLRDYLREKFFGDVHRQMYENRPIHWPLSSEKKTFVAWINIHRWNESTLRVLLADHLQPRLTQLEGELADLRQARDGADKSASKSAKDRLDDVQKWVRELQEFIRQVETCSDKGPPPTDAKCTAREVDARYVPDLDDGVMINSAALWPLLTPQWKDPKKWWTELANAKGKKDYDWSHLAMRYWPTRVDAKCQTDPSLAVAHGCFWKYHPARAWKWELRLQQEIGEGFEIEEAPYCPFSPAGEKVAEGRMRGLADGGHAQYRTEYVKFNGEEALQTIEAEALRRRKKLKQPQPNLTILEPGLWTEIPELCWATELRVIIKQGADFRLIALDEPEARDAFEKAHPDHVTARKRLIDKAAKENLFAAEDEEEGDRDGEVDADTDTDTEADDN